MKVYALMQQDRHFEPDVEIYTDRDKAIAAAKATAKKSAREQSDYEESEVDGWEFCAYYSCEGDMVRVLEKEVKQ